MLSRLEALIFDVDGTLADTERDGHRPAFNRAFARMNLDWNWSIELYRQLLSVAGGKERIKFYIDQYQPDWKNKPNLAELIADLHQLKNQYYQAILKEGAIPLRPGVKRLILEAREKGIRLAIATTSALPNALALLETTLNPSWFEVIAAGDIVPQKKPASDIYDYVLEQMKIKPENCLVFEDTAHGLQAATGANLKTIITVNDYTKNQNFDHAILVVNHLGEPNLPVTVLQGNNFDIEYLDLNHLVLKLTAIEHW